MRQHRRLQVMPPEQPSVEQSGNTIEHKGPRRDGGCEVQLSGKSGQMPSREHQRGSDDRHDHRAGARLRPQHRYPCPRDQAHDAPSEHQFFGHATVEHAHDRSGRVARCRRDQFLPCRPQQTCNKRIDGSHSHSEREPRAARNGSDTARPCCRSCTGQHAAQANPMGERRAHDNRDQHQDQRIDQEDCPLRQRRQRCQLRRHGQQPAWNRLHQQ